MRVFITGTAGFIGFHLARRLAADGHAVTGYDGLTDYYDVGLKHLRMDVLARESGVPTVVGMLEEATALAGAVEASAPDVIVHLAAQAGVRYSLEHPEAYASANLIGTFNLIESARRVRPRHLLITSTSSVYGGSSRLPFAETDAANAPMTLYAATKKAGEAMSHAYAHLWSVPTTCLRFFTAYGPWGRPDMALFKFVDAIEGGRPIEVFGAGRMQRDFTFIDDLVAAVVRLIARPPRLGEAEGPAGLDSQSPVAPWRVVNVAGGRPVGLLAFIAAIEEALGKRATLTMLPMQPGDVPETAASTELLRALIGYVPETPVEDGIAAFVDWYRTVYRPSRYPS